MEETWNNRSSLKDSWGCYFTMRHNVDVAAKERNGTVPLQGHTRAAETQQGSYPYPFLCVRNVMIHPGKTCKSLVSQSRAWSNSCPRAARETEGTAPSVGQGNNPQAHPLQTEGTSYRRLTKLQGLTMSHGGGTEEEIRVRFHRKESLSQDYQSSQMECGLNEILHSPVSGLEEGILPEGSIGQLLSPVKCEDAWVIKWVL